jgi:hypothetical protein
VVEPYFDLGTYTRGTSTASTSAQTWFDRGLVWCYAFHHEEAIPCFERALEHERGFALAHWGIAYAIGPNYNKHSTATSRARRRCLANSRGGRRASAPLRHAGRAQ